MNNYYSLMDKPETSPRDNFYNHLCGHSPENRALLQNNPDATVDEMMEVLFQSEDWLRASIAGNSHMPASVINSLLFDEVPKVRIEAIINRQTSFEVFKEAVLVDKYLNINKQRLAHVSYALKSLEIFENLWKAKASHQLIHTLISHLEELEKEKKDIPRDIQRLIDFVNDNLHTTTNAGRTYFIHMDKYVTSEAMDRLKNDSSKMVIEAISTNPNVWASTHRVIFTNHGDNFNIRTNLVFHTKDNALLNDIYKAYAGKKSRKFVETNPHFTLIP